MKYFIISTILLFTILGGMYVLTEGDSISVSTPTATQPTPSNDDKVFKNLKIE